MATKELTTGTPIKLILCFMFPVFLGNIFQQFYNLVDTLIVGRTLGLQALAAVGSTSPLIFLIISFIFASTQGFTVVTAQKFGARDYEAVRKSLAASIILSGALMVVMTAISAPLSYQMLALLRTPQDIISLASDYLFIMFIGIFATVFYNLSSNIIRALGDSKTPLYFLLFSSILNIFLDLLFILKFNMGVKGAGWATVVSQAVSTILCVSFMFARFPILKLKKEDWNLTKEFLMEHLNVGIPMGFQMSVLTLGIIALQFVLNSFGSTAIAAYTTGVRVEQIFTQSFLALGATMAVYTAQNFGAKKLSRIKDGAKSAILIAVSISVFAIIVLTFFSQQIIALFMSEVNHEVVNLATIYLHIVMIFFIFLGFLLIFRNVLQGMGSVGAPLASGTSELIARTAFAFIFGHYFGYVGVCTATPAAWISATIVLLIGYRLSLVKNLKKIRQRHG